LPTGDVDRGIGKWDKLAKHIERSRTKVPEVVLCCLAQGLVRVPAFTVAAQARDTGGKTIVRGAFRQKQTHIVTNLMIARTFDMVAKLFVTFNWTLLLGISGAGPGTSNRCCCYFAFTIPGVV
jgi:hypothetical protein